MEDIRSVCYDALRILCCWLPYIILLAPGVIQWDTGDQLAQYFGLSVFGMKKGVIWDHHPFFDTYLYGWFASLGQTIFHSYIIGLFIYSVVQIIILSIALSWMLAYLGTKGTPRALLKGITAFFCFFPVIPICAMSIGKDFTNAVFTVIWGILFYKLIDSNLTLLKKPKFLVAFVLISLLNALSKKLGLYVIALCLLLVLIGHFRIQLKGAILAIIVCLTLTVNAILPLCVYPVLHIIPADAQATIAVPTQMMARAAHDHPTDISKNERYVVDNYLGNTWDVMAENYNPYIADPATGFMLKAKTSFSSFAKVWFSVGLRHPLSYLRGLTCLESGWLTFEGPSNIEEFPHPPYNHFSVKMRPSTSSSVNKDTFGQITTVSKPSPENELVDRLYTTLMGIPVLNVLFYTALWTTVFPCFILYYLWRKRNRAKRTNVIFYALPTLISALSLFACSTTLSTPSSGSSAMRYMYHLVLLLPAAIGLLSTICSKTTGNEDISAQC
ncbi:DUF6020 family protein [Bifidobacterium bohemicum]|uniref:DUF6020 family protein n=1 Tax=Bifidobacterium bohemicum TaxID=638617 RepID=UPI0012E06350|nr:DUF6020 family protein [Bifidobacterium bohemicum]